MEEICYPGYQGGAVKSYGAGLEFWLCNFCHLTLGKTSVLHIPMCLGLNALKHLAQFLMCRKYLIYVSKSVI